jgi:hypothetical protein
MLLATGRVAERGAGSSSGLQRLSALPQLRRQFVRGPEGVFLGFIGESGDLLQLMENLQVTVLLSRTCYALWTMKVMNRWSIRMAKAKKCNPANVSGSRS